LRWHFVFHEVQLAARVYMSLLPSQLRFAVPKSDRLPEKHV